MLEEVFYSLGKAAASDLRTRAITMNGTSIIKEEISIPDFNLTTDYSCWPIGAPVIDHGQVWILLQPYNASEHPGTPCNLRTLWGLCHTKSPEHAKPWVEPLGTSGLYFLDECYRDADGTVHRCIVNETVFDADTVPQYWETC